MRLKKAAELQNSSNRNYCPKEQMSENKSVGATRRLNETLFQYQNKDELYGNTFDLDDDWLTNETIHLELPSIKQLSNRLQHILKDNEDYIFSCSPELIANIAKEIVRRSRDEPGGVTACRVHLHLVSREKCSASLVAEELKSSGNISSSKLGSSLASNNHVIETSQIEVYLLSSTSILSRLQSIVRSISLRNSQKDNRSKSRPQKLVLLPDYVLVKQKLFRSVNKKSVVSLSSVDK